MYFIQPTFVFYDWADCMRQLPEIAAEISKHRLIFLFNY